LCQAGFGFSLEFSVGFSSRLVSFRSTNAPASIALNVWSRDSSEFSLKCSSELNLGCSSEFSVGCSLEVSVGCSLDLEPQRLGIYSALLEAIVWHQAHLV